MKIIITIILLTGMSNAQTIYDLTPGTKENEIILTVANVSDENLANNVIVTIMKISSSLTFSKEEERIETINVKAEAEARFTFDAKRSAPTNKKDTVEFVITSPDGKMMTKQFIFSYTPPKEFKLEQNFPNPFNPTTTIQYQLPQDARVTLKVYDILGAEVATLVNEELDAGYYEVTFDASNFASEMYIYRLQTKDFVSVKKMMVVK